MSLHFFKIEDKYFKGSTKMTSQCGKVVSRITTTFFLIERSKLKKVSSKREESKKVFSTAESSIYHHEPRIKCHWAFENVEFQLYRSFGQPAAGLKNMCLRAGLHFVTNSEHKF